MIESLKHLARSPLLHFAVAGALIFAAWSAAERGRDAGLIPDAPEANQIVITPAELKVMVAYFGSQWRRLPTEAELEALIDARVMEEVLMREALELNLDQGDQVIRRRLSQKLEIALSEIAAVGEPTEAELAAFYAEHADRYVEPARVSFRHRFVSRERHGEATREQAVALLARLRSGEAVPGDPFHLPSVMREETAERLNRAFGPAFSERLLELAAAGADGWVGPVASPWGEHVVRVDGYLPPRPIPFTEARPDVLSAWREASARSQVAERMREMRRQYRVVLPPRDDIAGLVTP